MFEKNMEFLTPDQVRMIRSKRVAVIGLGALGQIAAHTLVRGGFERLTLVDGDRVSGSDFNRQLYADILTVGMPKTEIVCERLGDISPRLKLRKYDCFLEPQNAAETLAGADVILDCTDNVPTRLCMEEAAEQLGIPLIHGAVEGWFGQVCTVFPGDGILSVLYAGRKEQDESAMMPAVNVTASFQAAEALKIAAGKPPAFRNKLLCIDMLRAETEKIDIYTH